MLKITLAQSIKAHRIDLFATFGVPVDERPFICSLLIFHAVL